jgi:hypothetical protein
MIDATPRHLLIWGELTEFSKNEIITKFGGKDFNIMKPEVKDYIMKKYHKEGYNSNLKVVTK